MISMVVQTYWDIVDDTKEVAVETVDQFSDVLALLNEISKSNIDNYGVYPISNLRFSLMSKDNLDKIEVEDAKKERAEAEQAEEQEQKAREDEAEGKKLMEAELGSDDSTSQDSPSTQSDKTAADGSEEAPLESSDGEKSPAIPSAPVASSSKATQPKLVEDQVSTDDADKCDGNCDDCDNPGCQSNEKEDNLEGAEVGGDKSVGEQMAEEPCCLDCEMEEKRNAEETIENVPGSLADEQGGDTPAKTIPPMPEEEKDSQGAVDHETGADQVDDGPPENDD